MILFTATVLQLFRIKNYFKKKNDFINSLIFLFSLFSSTNEFLHYQNDFEIAQYSCFLILPPFPLLVIKLFLSITMKYLLHKLYVFNTKI